MKTGETKICEWCEHPFPKGNIPPSKWIKRRACCISHSGKLIARDRLKRDREIGELVTTPVPGATGTDPSWDGVVFPSYTMKSDARRMMQPETHVSYSSSASWAYRQ